MYLFKLLLFGCYGFYYLKLCLKYYKSAEHLHPVAIFFFPFKEKLSVVPVEVVKDKQRKQIGASKELKRPGNTVTAASGKLLPRAK